MARTVAYVHQAMLQHRVWLLRDPFTRIKLIDTVQRNSFLLIQDDTIHNLYGGNKARKLDALIPDLLSRDVTDVVTCGGLQSAHTSAVSAALNEASVLYGRHVRVHLLVRGERPAFPTGHHLMALMHAETVTYVNRSRYANRQAMLTEEAQLLSKRYFNSKVAVIEEGAQGPLAMLGFIRLVHWLASSSKGLPDPLHTAYHIVVDSGTGTSAVGLALGVRLMGLPWHIVGVMLAGNEEYYASQSCRLSSLFDLELSSGAFVQDVGLEESAGGNISTDSSVGLPLTWVNRERTRKFGNLLPGDVEACKEIARKHGVLVDPIWTLSAWEVSEMLSAEISEGPEMSPGGIEAGFKAKKAIVMLHTGGAALALQGLGQRFPDAF
ncbi:hypothetical protein CEUSTIGMA_g3760.t1 [Chlamydomonas eustigma]|uniref:Tryptophan synthase beta chain-like PALP domain-containing protein n=1 Tax=Chlamydomonas eustigma TaxID=1157962 RepID=A0A250WZP0_9CHLO|nr:hypothetical protein CEUSTIGMA_g3760.t1 [Chlamydomonas eustigma]|eukprot:GAX76314.1 hypothetical protein CEUSTIGMA_g3760.t1 [Chlamydomonas eustigma]